MSPSKRLWSEMEQKRMRGEKKTKNKTKTQVIKFMGDTHPAIKYIYISWPDVSIVF